MYRGWRRWGGFRWCATPKGTPGHHRDMTAQAAMPFAERAILQTAKVFAGSAIDMILDAERLRAARAEFEKATEDFAYDPIIPKRQKVPVDPP